MGEGAKLGLGCVGWGEWGRGAKPLDKSQCSAYALGAALYKCGARALGAPHYMCVAPSTEALHCWVRAQGLPRWTGVQRPRARRCTVGCGAGVAGATQKG